MGQLWMQISGESGSVFNANQQAVHTMPKNGNLLVDQLFKKIRAFKQAEQVRNKECQLRYTNDNQTS